MSFEKIPIESSSINPGLPPIREERVIQSFYKRPDMTQLATPKPESGQLDIHDKNTSSRQVMSDEVRLTPQAAALAKKEMKFRQQQQQLEQEKKSIAAERAEIAQLKAMKDKLAAKDYSGVDDLIDYNEYSQYKVNKMNGADPVQDEIKKLNQKISELEKNGDENLNRQFEAAVQERKIAAKQLLDSSEQFPITKFFKAHDHVAQHIVDTFEHDQVELSVEEATKEVETILLEQAKQWEQVQAVLQDKPTSPEAKKSLPPMKPKGLQTLTNQVIASSAQRPLRPYDQMNDSERWQEARRRAEERLAQMPPRR